MSVRATDKLVGDLVFVTRLPKGPQMVVQSVNKEENLAITAWFSTTNEYQEGIFPVSALDRVEEPKKPAQAKTQKKPKK